MLHISSNNTTISATLKIATIEKVTCMSGRSCIKKKIILHPHDFFEHRSYYFSEKELIYYRVLSILITHKKIGGIIILCT